MRADVRPKARWPGRTVKGSGEHREAPKAEDTDLQLADFPNGLQAIENLKTCPATARVDSTTAKTVIEISQHLGEIEG
jgi:hypothetical protein